MSLEIELKFFIGSYTSGLEMLKGLRCSLSRPEYQEDTYFSSIPSGSQMEDASFRLRTTSHKLTLTHKYSVIPGDISARAELEIEINAGGNSRHILIQMLERLGLNIITVIKKRRTSATIERNGLPITLSLDEVENLGSFIELEAIVADDMMDLARDVLAQLASLLGLYSPVKDSYLTLILHKTSP